MRYLALTILLPVLNAQPAAPPADPHRALLDTYCVTCHNQRAKTAGLTFDTMDLAHPEKDIAIWEKAVRKLQGGMMPPPERRRPDQASVDSLVKYLETSLDQAAAAHPNPGSVPLHRLNRAEYANAIHDLFAIDVDPAALLPTDDISNGFDNIAGVLKVSPSFLDQYITAARAVSMEAVGQPLPADPPRVSLKAAPGGSPSDALPLGVRGSTVVQHLFPATGEYEFTGVNAGSMLLLDGARIGPNVRVPIKAGMHTVAMVTPERSLAESEALLESFIPGQGGPTYGGNGVRARGGAGLQVAGPYNTTGSIIDPPNRQRVFVCRPASEADEVPCATRIFSSVAHRAFRRPVTAKDVDPPLAFFKEARKSGNFESAIQDGLIAILASPKFLYRAEPPRRI